MAAKDKKLLAMEPNDKIRFVGDLNSEIKTYLKITNKSDMKQAFKIKCTRNDLFKIRPATGILDYDQTSNITITYKKKILTTQKSFCGPKIAEGHQAHVSINRPNGEIPENDKHHFGVYHIPAPEGCTCEGAWSEHYGPPQGEFKLKAEWEDTIKGQTSPRDLSHSGTGGCTCEGAWSEYYEPP
uniref:Major sperm protein n=1 Tax=Angiostrongylus cantonensis TaxID=6313 RepID=A0A0K0CTB0_ANGCA